MSPQTKYNREVRQCPIVRKIESNKQRVRRSTEEYKLYMRNYMRIRRAIKKPPKGG